MSRGRAFAAIAVTLAVAGPPAVAALALPAASAPVAWVVAPPWVDADAVVARAGAQPVGPVQPRLGRLVAGGGDGLEDRLRAAGAWIVLWDARLLRVCGVWS